MSGILSFVLTVINIGFDGRLLFIWPRNWAIAFVIASFLSFTLLTWIQKKMVATFEKK
jgi:hypothetical protein